jgi:hypothetical protein
MAINQFKKSEDARHKAQDARLKTQIESKSRM